MTISNSSIKKGKATEVSQHVAEVLIEERVTKRGLTQRAFADMLGVSFQQYQKYEKGKDRISLEKAMILCEKLGISLDVFRENETASGFGEATQAAFDAPKPTRPHREQQLMDLFATLPKKLQVQLLEMAKTLAKVIK